MAHDPTSPLASALDAARELTPTDGSAAEFWSALPTVDWVGLGLLGLLFVLGFFRGLWWQVMRLAGLAAAVAVARALGPALVPRAERAFPALDPHLVAGMVWLLLFLAALALAAALGRVGHRLLEAMKLGTMDRVAGALAGALTALLLHATLVALVLQLAPRELAHRAISRTYSERLVGLLVHPLPLLFDVHTTNRVRLLLAAPPGAAGGLGEPAVGASPAHEDAAPWPSGQGGLEPERAEPSPPAPLPREPWPAHPEPPRSSGVR